MKTRPRISFSLLRELLLEMGFEMAATPKSHIGFHHEATGAEIVLPKYRSNQIVAPRHLLMVRIMLDAKGLMEADTFEDFVETNSRERSAS